EKRTTSFIKLASAQNIDFGFVVYKSSTVVTETLLPPEILNVVSAGEKANRAFIDAAEYFYRKLDEHVERMVKYFPGAEIILVSDHSTVVRRYSVNVNAFLVKEGFQKPSAVRRTALQYVRSLAQILPHSVRSAIRKNKNIESRYRSMLP